MPDIRTLSYALVGITFMGGLVLLALVVMAMRLAGGRTSTRHAESRGEVAMLSMALQDAVNKLKAQERATAARAERSERLAEQIIEGLTSGLIVVDHEGHVQTVNPAARRLLRLEIGETAEPLETLLLSAPALAAVIREATGADAPVMRRTVRIDGARPSYLGVTVSLIHGASNELQAAVCLFTDPTAVIELEEQLRLKEALAQLGGLTAGLAHEFRNGLATIHGYARLIDPATLAPQERTCVEGLRAETAALGEVVNNFLRFAKPDTLVLVPVGVEAIMRRAIEDASDGAVGLAGMFGEVDGDEVLLRQAFSNLLRNAFEACAAAGVEAVVSVAGDIADGVQTIVVDDNGPGIPKDVRPRLFQPFATTKPAGTGLGLAVVQKVIVSHNGRIEAGNRPDGGARFHIRLPLSRPG